MIQRAWDPGEPLGYSEVVRIRRKEYPVKQLRVAVVALLLVVLLAGSMAGTAEAGGKSDPCAKKNPPPECEIPEVPWTLVLPLAGIAIAGGYYLIDRRRHQDDPAQLT